MTASKQGTPLGALSVTVGTLGVAVALTLYGCGDAEVPATPTDVGGSPSGSLPSDDGGRPADGGEGDTAAAPAVDPLFVSGSRLKARRYRSQSGLVEFVDWYDSVLKTPCAFQTGSDGVPRCYPSAVSAATLEFSDAACTAPALGVYVAACNPPQAVAEVGRTCGGPGRFFAVGPKSAAATVYTKDASGCRARAVDTGRESFALGSEFPASSLVSGARIPKESAERLVVDSVVASDGTISFVDYVDNKLSVRCNFAEYRTAIDSPLKIACMPSLGGFNRPFSDAACSVPSATIPIPGPANGQCETPLPDYVSLYDAPSQFYRAMSSASTSSIYYSRPTTQCFGFPSEQYAHFLSLGAAVTYGDFVNPIEQVRGTSRLKQIVRTSGSTTSPHVAWFDSVTNARCKMLTAADGNIRCLPEPPSGVFYADHFLDAGCKNGVRLFALPAGGTLTLPVTPTWSCGFSSLIAQGAPFRVVAPVSPAPATYVLKGGVCAAATGSEYTVVHSVVSEVPAAQFEIGKLVTD